MAKHQIHRAGGVAVDLCGPINTADNVLYVHYEGGNWRSVLRAETENYKYGHLMISAEMQVSLGMITPTDVATGHSVNLPPEFFPHVEVKVLVWYGLTPQIWFEGALGNYDAPEIGGIDKSAGPICLPFALGEVPDSIEVFARSHRAYHPSIGAALYPGEVCTCTATTRFIS